jgi:hypothetical protein
MSVVYVFGAGASRHVGYPFASEMGGGLFDYMLSIEGARASAQFLMDRFGKSKNFEDLITEIQLLINELKNAPQLRDRVERSDLGHSMGQMIQFSQQWFREIRQRPAPLYAEFAQRILQPEDAVITFNYDDSLERELRTTGRWDIGDGYGFPISNDEATSEVIVLKLHGSINWLINFFGGATGGAFLVNPGASMGGCPVIHPVDFKFLGYEGLTGRTYKSGGAIPCLIMPGRNKEFFYDTSFGHEFSDFWDHLWRQASQALEKCSRVVICGYSLLPVDERACNLLLKRPPKDASVEVISGSQTERIANDFSAAGFSDVRAFKGGYFKDWLDAQF